VSERNQIVNARGFIQGWVWRFVACVAVLLVLASIAFVGHAWKPGAETVGSRRFNISGAVLCLTGGVVVAKFLLKRGRHWKPKHGLVAMGFSLVGSVAIGVVAVVFFPITIGVWSGRRRVRNGTQLTRLERLAAVQQLLR
jgi:uncharacterized membrane protein